MQLWLFKGQGPLRRSKIGSSVNDRSEERWLDPLPPGKIHAWYFVMLIALRSYVLTLPIYCLMSWVEWAMTLDILGWPELSRFGFSNTSINPLDNSKVWITVETLDTILVFIFLGVEFSFLDLVWSFWHWKVGTTGKNDKTVNLLKMKAR